MKIALVHDYLREYGGAERVVEVFHEMWPEAPLYTSFVDWPSFAKAPAGKVELFQSMDIRTSWVQNNPIVKRWHSPLRFLAPMIWNSFDLSEFDVVLSSSGWFMSRGVAVRQRTSSLEFRALQESTGKDVHYETRNSKPDARPVHICYIHHPPRNLYGYETGGLVEKYKIVRFYAAIINFFLRHYDFETAQAVDYFIANSKETARRVEKFYRRDSAVIYPPIDVYTKRQSVRASEHRERNEAVTPDALTPYYLSVGRLTYSKRIDLAIQACNALKLPLKIVGEGKEEAYLRSIAGPTIEFVGGVSDQELSDLYAGAKALLFCARHEDFGIVPVEAMGYGVPIIALAEGGVLETVIEGKTGMLFEHPDVEELKTVLLKLEKTKKDWSEECIGHAKKFSKERFIKEIRLFVEKISP